MVRPTAPPVRPPRAWAARAAAALCLLLAAAAPVQAQDELEYAVKATFLYKLAAFVEWPPAAFAGGGGALRLCVVGANPFGDQLEQLTAGQRVAGHPIEIRRFAAPDQAVGCHMLYVAGAAPAAARALQTVSGRPVLTITDASFQDSARGVIHFVVLGGRVRFEIDPAPAARNGVTLSSKLASLAAPARPRSL